MTPIERDNHKMQVVEDTIDAHSDANVEVGRFILGTITRMENAKTRGWDKISEIICRSATTRMRTNKLGDHVIVQSHQFEILCSNAMLFNNGSCLLKGKTGGCVIDRQPKAQRIFDGHKICCTTFIKLEEPHYVRLRNGSIIPIRSIIVRVEVEVPNQYINYFGCDRHL